ncbi:hypothetical protein HY634_03060 [Candidatus Uhrbacteria bacterium]|nr:hypothetical protein [Candidatus Uhrbacteria bacterium]
MNNIRTWYFAVFAVLGLFVAWGLYVAFEGAPMNAEYAILMLSCTAGIAVLCFIEWNIYRLDPVGRARADELNWKLGGATHPPTVPETEENLTYRGRLQRRLDAIEEWYGWGLDNTPLMSRIAVWTVIIVLPITLWYYFGRVMPAVTHDERPYATRKLEQARDMDPTEQDAILANPHTVEYGLVVAVSKIQLNPNQNIPPRARDAASWIPFGILLSLILIVPLGWVASWGDEFADGMRWATHQYERLLERLRARGTPAPAGATPVEVMKKSGFLAGFWRFAAMDLVMEFLLHLGSRLLRGFRLP